MVSFPALSATLLFGSLWAYVAWGYYWNWDPKENAALATWLLYAVYIHMRVRRSRQDAVTDALLLLAFGATLFTYAGNLFFHSLHSYSGL